MQIQAEVRDTVYDRGENPGNKSRNRVLVPGSGCKSLVYMRCVLFQEYCSARRAISELGGFVYVHMSTPCLEETRTPTIFYHNFTKTSRLWVIFDREDHKAITY